MSSIGNWLSSKVGFSTRITFIAMIVRLIPVLLTMNVGIGLDDMFQYDMLARSLASGNGYRWYSQQDLQLILPYLHLDLSSGNYDPRGVPTTFRPPLYPAFLALVYWLAGSGPRRFFYARLVQVFLGAALVPLTYNLSRLLFPANESGARIAAWVIALYPMLVVYPISLASENLFFLIFLGATYVLLKAVQYPTWRGSIFSGFLFGLMALTRSVSLLCAGIAILWVWFRSKRPGMAGLILAAISLTILPWIVRNSLLSHKLTGIENSLGYQLYLGYNPAGTGTFIYPQSLDLLTILDDSKRDEVGRAKAWEFIKADPGRVPYLFIRRAGYFFGLERRALTYFYSNDYFGFVPTPILVIIALIVLLPFILVSCSSVFGLVVTRWWPEITLVMLLLIGYILPHLAIIAEDRFHLAIVPFLAILAAQLWTSGWMGLRTRWQERNGKLAIILAFLAVFLLVFNWGAEIWRDADKITALLGPAGNQTFFPY